MSAPSLRYNGRNWYPILVGNWGHLSKDSLSKIYDDIMKRMESKEWRDNPFVYLSAWEKRRGNTEELRIPEDGSRQIMRQMADSLKKQVGQIQQHLQRQAKLIVDTLTKAYNEGKYADIITSVVIK